MATWPEAPQLALAVLRCESQDGQHPATYDLGAQNGGPMQINRLTWAGYFAASYGWSWAEVVTDLDIHFTAAREIWLRAGGSFAPWTCAR